MSTHHITAGFMPLLDAAILIAARECGFSESQGIGLQLVRETSWANIRDRLAVGHFEAAHLLAPMPIASNLSLTAMPLPLIAPMALGLGGNAVTFSLALADAAAASGAMDPADPAAVGKALATVVAARRRSGEARLQFAVVHPHSGHNFELRYWLSACGIDPQSDVEIVIVPPPLMPDALKSGRIDGFCVGEPWNSLAVASGSGRIATTKSAIWRASPEKVLGVRADVAERDPEAIAALLRALWLAAQWCGNPENHPELCNILARSEYLAVPAAVILRALSGNIDFGGGLSRTVADFFVPAARAATFPWQSHALWFYSQMVRWGQVSHTPENAAIALRSFRPDLYRAALAPLDAAVPSANSKVEGALTHPLPVGAMSGELILGPDGFFDGTVFDPSALDAYIKSQGAHIHTA